MQLSPHVADGLAVFLVVISFSALVVFAWQFEAQRDIIVGALVSLANIIAVWFFQRDKSSAR